MPGMAASGSRSRAMTWAALAQPRSARGFRLRYIRPVLTAALPLPAPIAEATLAVVEIRRSAAFGRLTGMAYAITNEDLRKRVTEVTAQSYAFGEQWIREVVREQDLPMTPGEFVRTIHALSEGLVFQRLQELDQFLVQAGGHDLVQGLEEGDELPDHVLEVVLGEFRHS